MRAIAVLAIAAVAGCTTEPAGAAPAGTLSTLATPFDQIGKPCKPERRLAPTRTFRDLVTTCLGRRLVAVRGSAYRRIPSNARVVYTSHVATSRGNGTTIAIEGDRIWVRVITCARCAAIMGRTVLIDAANLTGKTARRLQAALGLRDDVALGGIAGWKAELVQHQQQQRARITDRQCKTDADCVATSFAGCCPHCSCRPWYPARRDAVARAKRSCAKLCKAPAACRTCTKQPVAACRHNRCLLRGAPRPPGP